MLCNLLITLFLEQGLYPLKSVSIKNNQKQLVDIFQSKLNQYIYKERSPTKLGSLVGLNTLFFFS